MTARSPTASAVKQVMPSGWRRVRLGDLLREVNMRGREVDDYERLPVLSLTRDRGLIPQHERFQHRVARADVSDYKVVKKEWLVYNPYVIWEGAIHVLREIDAGLVSPVYPTWQVSGADPLFMDHVLRTPELLAEYSRLSSGVVRRRRTINKLAFLDIEIDLPTEAEQAVIREMIRALREEVDSTNRVIACTLAAKAAARAQLLDSAVYPRRGTEAWQVAELKQLLREPLRNGHSAAESSSGKGVKTLTLTAVTKSQFSDANTKLTSADPSKVAGLWLQPGDILVERANTRELVGMAALYDGPSNFAIYPDLMIRVRVKEDVADPTFVAEALLAPSARRHFQEHAHGTAGSMPKIGHRVLETVQVPLPPLDYQRRAARALRLFEEKVETEEARSAALKRLQNSILRRLLKGELSPHSAEVATDHG